ncbi:EamA family transporter [Nocardia bovistercoris]|uniref:EamA family transporter n=1 Tax=Nocardia bovistercoris TaxID=2785916 RepID=UPI002FCD4BC2
MNSIPSAGPAARIAKTALAPMVWGTTYVVTTELLPPGHPLFAALARALPAGLLVLAFSRTAPRGEWWWRSAVLGALNIGLFFPLLFVAAQRLPGGVAATVAALAPTVVAVLAVLVLRERPSIARLGWAAAGAVGVAMVVLGPAARFDALGILAGLGAAVVMAFGVTLTKLWGRPDYCGPATFAGWQLTAGGVILLPVTLLVEGTPPPVDSAALLGYLWLGLVGGALAYILWFRGLAVLPVTSVAILGLLSPMVAAVLGVVVLGQSFGPLQLAGFTVVLAAVLATQLTGRTRPSRARELPENAAV